MSRGYLTGKVFIKHEKETDKLRLAGGSWTLNLDEFPVEEEVEKLKYITDKYVYEIEVKAAFSVGFTRVLGGEQKLVIPLVHWNRSKK